MGVNSLRKLEERYPDQYGAILALFEDEALNSGKSSALINTYIKERLDFGEKKEGGAQDAARNVKVVFQHDIIEDGK